MASLKDIPLDMLLHELRGRVHRLQAAAQQPSSVGVISQALDAHARAWRLQGVAEQWETTEALLSAILDEATAKFDAPHIAGEQPPLEVWREARRHLWQLVEDARKGAATQGREAQQSAQTALNNSNTRIRYALLPAKRMSVRLAEVLLGRINAWESRRDARTR